LVGPYTLKTRYIGMLFIIITQPKVIDVLFAQENFHDTHSIYMKTGDIEYNNHDVLGYY